jgi:hypothetical protein
MKNILIITIASIALSACAMFTQRPGPVQVVTVDKAVPYCPAPPVVPQYSRMVDKLVPTDVSDPGKVVTAYVYDVTVLRTQVKIYQEVLDEYNKTHQDFTAVQAEIDKLQVK